MRVGEATLLAWSDLEACTIAIPGQITKTSHGRTFTLPPPACRWLAAAARKVPHHEAWLGLPWSGRAASQRARRPGGHHQAGGEARDRRGEQPLIAPLCPHRCPSATSRIPRVQTPSLIEPACVICRWTQGSLVPHNTAPTQAGEHRGRCGPPPGEGEHHGEGSEQQGGQDQSGPATVERV